MTQSESGKLFFLTDVNGPMASTEKRKSKKILACENSYFVLKFLSCHVFTSAGKVDAASSILYMSMLSFYPNALLGSAEQQGCVQDLCPAQRECRSLYRDCHAGSARKGNMTSGQGQPPPLPHSKQGFSVWTVSNP